MGWLTDEYYQKAHAILSLAKASDPKGDKGFAGLALQRLQEINDYSFKENPTQRRILNSEEFGELSGAYQVGLLLLSGGVKEANSLIGEFQTELNTLIDRLGLNLTKQGQETSQGRVH